MRPVLVAFFLSVVSFHFNKGYGQKTVYLFPFFNFQFIISVPQKVPMLIMVGFQNKSCTAGILVESRAASLDSCSFVLALPK